nr:MAG TPA: hypothetical protein [Caudoviricetes sp.]
MKKLFSFFCLFRNNFYLLRNIFIEFLEFFYQICITFC